ncbi:MAG: hypothetical protein Q8K26_05120 [Candidatus Gracilibacteria bacterium]|nr:hypothetical protein [Candidatus Gracilibacteria bacterium]
MNKPVHYPYNSSKLNVPHNGRNGATDIFEMISAIVDHTHIGVDLSDTCDALSRVNKITRNLEERGLYKEGLLYSGGNYRLRREDYMKIIAYHDDGRPIYMPDDDLAYGWIQNIEDEGKDRGGRLYKLLKAFPEKNLSYRLSDNPWPPSEENPIIHKIIYVIDPDKLVKSKTDPDVYFILDEGYVVATMEIK